MLWEQNIWEWQWQFAKFLRCPGETYTHFSCSCCCHCPREWAFIQLWLKCALFQPRFYLCLSQTDESLRRYYQAGAVRTIMKLWQFQDREVWSSWHAVVHNSGALAEVLENEWIFLTLLLASALISPLFFFFFKKEHSFPHFYTKYFPRALIIILIVTYVINLRYFWA